MYFYMIQYQLFAEVPQNQSSTNEQDNNFGKFVSAAETNNHYNLAIENDGSTMHCNSKNATAEDSVQMVRYMACEKFLMICTCGN